MSVLAVIRDTAPRTHSCALKSMFQHGIISGKEVKWGVPQTKERSLQGLCRWQKTAGFNSHPGDREKQSQRPSMPMPGKPPFKGAAERHPPAMGSSSLSFGEGETQDFYM